MIKTLHPVAGATALVTIITFWLSTVFAELFASEPIVIAVKTSIPWGLFLLIPSLVAVGGTGFALAKGRRAGLVGTKAKRMPFIAANGILILVPAALFLSYKAAHSDLDNVFYTVQGIELLVGATNIIFLSLNMRDGLKLRRQRLSRLG